MRKKNINTIIDPLLIAKTHTFAAGCFVPTLSNLGIYCVTIHGATNTNPFTVPGTQKTAVRANFIYQELTQNPPT
jgi:hypothetical protein